MVENTKPEEPKDQKLVMIISLDPKTNDIQVSGPIHDQVLSLGMIEAAKVAMIQMFIKAGAERLVKPNGHGILDFVRGGKK